MAYSITLAGDTIVVQDGTINQDAVDLTLIGKNYSGFGQSLNENFVKLLENFSDSTPLNPIKGQLWYDSTVSKLKVYSGTAFVPVSSTTVAAQQPLNMGVGDLWYNTTTKQLNFWDGSSVILLGPAYTASQRKSGFVVYTVNDTQSHPHVITCIYSNNILLGLFATEAFTLQNQLTGYSPDGVVVIGFNQGTLQGFRFDIKATDSDKLDGHAAIEYFRTGKDNYTDHQIYIDSNDGLSVKVARLRMDSNTVVLENTLSNQPIVFRGKYGNTVDDAIQIQPGSRTVNVGTSDVPYQLNLYQSPSIGSSVTNKTYVDTAIKADTVLFSITIDGTMTEAQILNILDKMAPHYEHPIGTTAKVLCSFANLSTPRIIRVYRINNAGNWQLRPLENITI